MKPTFRTKILLALFGLIVSVLAVMLATVTRQTNLQVQRFTTRSEARAVAAFKDAEESNRGRLEGLGRRLAGSPRASALLVSDPDTAFVRTQLGYELSLAQEDSSLVAWTDLEGHPLGGVISGTTLRNPAEAVPEKLLSGMLERADTAGFGYQFLQGRLYSVFVALVRDVDRPIGFFVVGRPIDQAMAENIGNAVEGSVCFLANDRCVASNADMARSGLTAADMVHATKVKDPRVRRDGKRWMIMAEPLTGGTGWRVIARPLDDVLKPFEDIRNWLLLVGLIALAIASVVAVVVARGLAQPIRALVEATARIAHGDYKAHVPVTSSDELGQLSSAFNEMADGLQLKETYRGLLDKVISPEIADEMLRSEISLGGENREVTVLFADLRGFTSFTENMEPQEVIHILNETMERATSIVEREGGVVDKYIGDEIMALFGAPISHPDDALRAARAAVGIRDAIAALSSERIARGERGLAIGIGINTGDVVAGNMGSERRLNYTVLGMSVNVAARLCSQSDAGSILIGDETYQRVKQYCSCRAAGQRALRGLSTPLATYFLLDIFSDDDGSPTRDPEGEQAITNNVAAGASTLGIALLCTALGFGGAHAQRTPLVSYTQPSGFIQATLGARFDATFFAPHGARPWLIHDTASFIAPRASVFGEGFIGSAGYLFAELRVDRGELPATTPLELRIEQLFARISAGHVLSLQAGKFVSPFGSYAQRHGTDSDPFIRPPLAYEWPTMNTPGVVGDDTNDFLDWKFEPAKFRPIGVPPIWAVPYQVGVMTFGTVQKASYRLAVMNSAPSSIPPEWDRIADLWRRPSFVASVSYNATPALHAGASYDHGPFMRRQLAFGAYPAGKTGDDYDQTIFGIDAGYARDHVEVRGEFFVDRWEVPHVTKRALDYSYYIETKAKLSPGFFVAGRLAQIRFNEMTRTAVRGTPNVPAPPTEEGWDFPVTRIQLGTGYQINQTLSLRGEYQWTVQHAATTDVRSRMLSLQFRIDP